MCLRRAPAVEVAAPPRVRCLTAPRAEQGSREPGRRAASPLPARTGRVSAAVPLPQGTVRTFDPQDRSGDLLLDDGTLLPFPGSAVDPVVRLLRPGQRVRLRLDDGGVRQLTLLTLPFSTAT